MIEDVYVKAEGHNVWLERLLKRYGFKTFVEVGVAKGDLTKYILANVQLDKYYAVDPWRHYEGAGAGDFEKVTDESWERLYLETLKLCTDSILQVFRVPSLTAANLFRGMKFDCVFLDADHSYEAAKADLEAWWPLVREGGVLCGHDYSNRYKHEVKRAVNEFFGADNKVQLHRCWGFRK